ncbi:unnamed protein product [Polarella glacialis]|uniref:Uncharacterized protein n=1 Tax=Polarella glacialis TaxID=89957 RepID=A0A813HJX8_POLGL|nr:unnamed protein product [Polarella glacialis]CAE8708678.1 unnamed protein product [Polarella glacialis]
MATAALWVASGWLPPAARAVAREPHGAHVSSSKWQCQPSPHAHGCCQSRPSLCQDTSGYIIEQLWPAQPSSAGRQLQASATKSAEAHHKSGQLSPRSFESRLRHSAPLLQDLQQVAAVSQNWAHRANADGWPAAHNYLYQEPGSRGDLQQRYTDSMRTLLVKDWLCRAPPAAWPPHPQGGSIAGPEGLVGRIVSYVRFQ